eukprot:m.225383 g.225383  ORF g.225383 m.225383 type:complete len:91 (+) comp15157_c2_seq22:78-350(+)
MCRKALLPETPSQSDDITTMQVVVSSVLEATCDSEVGRVGNDNELLCVGTACIAVLHFCTNTLKITCWFRKHENLYIRYFTHMDVTASCV